MLHSAAQPGSDFESSLLSYQPSLTWLMPCWHRRSAVLMVACLQDAKLTRLEASLHQREEQIENHHAERISALRSRRSREVQQKLAYLHRYTPAHPLTGLQAQLLVC